MIKLFTLNKYSLALIFLILCANVFAQTIDIQGNGQLILDGETSTSTTDFTDFGLTTSRSFTMNKTNNGNPKIDVSSISLSNTTDFTITTNPAPVNNVSNKIDFTIGFNTSTTCGTYTSIVYVYTNATNDGGDNAWTFTISATVGPEMDIVDASLVAISDGSTDSPSALNSTDFGNVGVGFNSAPQTYTIQNTHPSCPLTLLGAPIVSLSNTTDFTVNYASTTTTVLAGGSTTFTITFNPMSAATLTSTVTIANDDPNEAPYVFTVQGTGQTPQPEMDVLGGAPLISIVDGTTSTNPLDWTAFGNTAVGVPIVRTFTIDNTAGTATLNITNPVTLSSTGTATGTYFAVTTPPPATVAAGATATFQVTFNPTIRGDFLDFLTIVNDDSDENPYEFSISGTSYIAASGDTWYFHDAAGVDLDATLPTWKTDTGLYSTWSAGPSQLGYGDGDEVTTISNNGQITTYFRQQVTASATEAGHSTLVIRALRDDGIIVYINGTKVWQNNMGATSVNYLTQASSDISGNPENAWLQYKLSNVLITGTNEIAVEIHQGSTTSDISFDFALYTEDGNIPPDVDGDYVVDYLDNDVDGDGVPDIVEGCYTSNLGQLHSSGGTDRSIGSAESINSTIDGTTITMDDGNTLTFAKTGTFSGIQSYFAGEHGWSVRTQGAGTSGTLEFDFGTNVSGLFFKLADFDENETYTVDVYDGSGALIDLSTSGNVYQLGAYINQSGNTFNDKFLGNGINNDGDAVISDPFGSVYFYFPNTAVSRILFSVEQPNGSSIRITAMHYCSLDTDGDGIDDYHDSDSDNDGIPDLVEAGGYDTDGNGIIDNLDDTDGDGLADIYDATPAVYFADESSTIIDYDFDGDGIPSRIDLDSDNDGIADIIEAGDPDTNSDGRIDGFTDTNNDGYHDAYDGGGSTAITGADGNSDGLPDSYPNDNQDGSGLPNYMDIDSDDDGITDNTEAQPTSTYVTFVITDTDGDGFVDAFENSDAIWGGGGFAPEDTDNDGTPDYLDTDSDDSEEADSIEGHDTNGDNVVDGSDAPNANTGLFTGVDADADGLDDGFDNNISTYDATNTNLQATSHPDFDGGADRDWRSTIGVSLDFDGLDDHVDCGDQSAYEFASSFSLEAWVLQETNTSIGTIISKNKASATSGNRRGYYLALIEDLTDPMNPEVKPNLTWYNNSGTKIVDITSPYPITNNRWYHIAATYDGTTAKLFIDGIEVIATPSSVAAPDYDDEKFLIGATYDGDNTSTPKNHFNGFIDEVRVWNTALNVQQLREMMNQEIEQSPNGAGTGVIGKVIPIDISGGLLWEDLEGYYDMNDDDGDDKSSHSRNGTPKNITTLQEQTAPLPYTTKADGDWDDTTATTPWTLGDTVWDYPNALGIDGTTKIDWNIVQISHDIDSADDDITVLGLISDTSGKTLTIANPSETLDENNSGHSLRVTNYLKLDGDIDLVGESQLLQDEGSILDTNSSGSLEKDQQGTQDLYTYNYWSSPVSKINTLNNHVEYTLPEILRDGLVSATPRTINFLTSGYNGTPGTPGVSSIGIADYWIWKFANRTEDDYSQWQHVRSSGELSVGQGFTMKGVESSGSSFASTQNYVFNGKPNNGDITLPITAGHEYLLGNPYPSAIDADEFIRDNIKDGGNNTQNVINGALYFWEHFASNTHYLKDYQGGYGIYTLMGSTEAISSDARINNTGTLISTKGAPGRYIPVGQGFFVNATIDASLTGETNDPALTSIIGGNIIFKNSQRVFVTEASASSIFMKSSNTKSKPVSQSEQPDTRLKIKLNVDTPKGYHRKILVGVDENASNNFDIGYDAPLIEDNNEDMFWIFNDSKFIIQAVNNFGTDQSLPIGIKISTAGLTTIKIDSLENIENNFDIYLYDKELNISHDLRASDYEVYLSAGNYLSRFEITFSSLAPKSLGLDDLHDKAIQVYYENEKTSIILHNPDLIDIKSIEMFNIIGQSVYMFDSLETENYLEFKTKPLNTGAYIINIKTVNNQKLSKKILIK